MTMSLPESKFHFREESHTSGARVRPRRLAAVLMAFAAFASQALTAQAQTPTPTPYGNCPPSMQTGQSLFWVPEVAAPSGNLRGTVMLGSEQRWIPNRIPKSAPADSSTSQCFPQYVRYFVGLDTVRFQMQNGVVTPVPYADKRMDSGYPAPQPGPTLRARVGSLIQLAFINQINPNDFAGSIDRDEQGKGCDQTTAGYPGADRYPDCFHGSSTGNIHFHGTHTNPNTTGDNVFIEVRPSIRENGKPVVTPERVGKWFEQFFTRCEQELGRGPLRLWPTSWADMPKPWTDDQETLLKAYDQQLVKLYGTKAKQLWPVDAVQIAEGAWPQYYIGAYPYCFRVPEYTSQTWPPPPPAATTVMGGAGTAEAGHEGTSMGGHGATTAGGGHGSGAQLRMGQSPGTHWYHAHKHGSTAINVANGMTGAFIIEGTYDDDLNKWYGTDWTRTQPVLVINQLGTAPNLMRGGGSAQDKGPDFSVNGQLRPVITMRPGEVQMWRILNTSGRAAAKFMPQPAGALQWKQLAQDGVQFKDINYQRRTFDNVVLASGNRADILVKAPTTPCSKPGGCYPVLVKNNVDPADLATANQITLLSVNVEGAPVDPTSNQAKFIPTAPAFPAFLGDISDDEITGTKTLVFASTGSPGGGPSSPVMHKIDGKKFDGEVGEVVLLNRAEEWKIVNESYPSTAIVSHPFHIHINPFQVTDIFDPNATFDFTYTDPKTKKKMTATGVAQYAFIPGDLFKSTNAGFQKAVRAKQCQLNPFADPDTWKPCTPFVNKDNIWWDVFPIPSGRNVNATKGTQPVTVNVPGWFKMRSRFVDFPGFYVLHCHILAHEDRGMMTIVEVAPARTPYSHN
jgi:FtsP/CotA-like multicopper oxidase with cupredoxin domain